MWARWPLAEHRRRDGYWKVYHLAHTRERDALVSDIVSLVRENRPPPRRRGTGRGRKRVHSWEKLACICVVMVAMNWTFREAENEVPSLGLPWEEPFPDHATIHRAFQEMPQDYLEEMLEGSASRCLKEGRWRRGLVAADSTGAETDRYETVVRPVKERGSFEEVRRIVSLKLHVIAVLDLMVVLRARVTGEHRHDAPVLREMLKGLVRLPGSVFDADRGYDADSIFRRIHELSMSPNIKQRETWRGPRWRGGKRHPFRTKAARSFDVEAYHYRGLIEGIWGAEETKGHSLRTRFRKRECQERWGLMLCIAWNARVWNRLKCSKELGMEVKPLIWN